MSSAAPDSLRLELDAPPRVSAGSAAAMRLRARNIGTRPLQLYLRGRVIVFDLVVSDGSGAVVWRRLHDQVVPAIVQAVTLAPGDRLEFRDSWDLRTSSGGPVSPGVYSTVGLLLRDQPEPYTSPSARIEVVPR